MGNNDTSNDYLLEIFILETNQLIEQLEDILLNSEKEDKISSDDVEEIFRIMHTIKGSASMMSYKNISSVSHALEDLFDYIRHNNDNERHFNVYDVVLLSMDFIKSEINKIGDRKPADGNEEKLIASINSLLGSCKNKSDLQVPAHSDCEANTMVEKFDGNYKVKVIFEKDCKMENMRAFAIVYSLKEMCSELYYYPPDIEDNRNTSDYIAKNGFDIYIKTEESEENLKDFFDHAVCVSSYTLEATDKTVEEFKPEKSADDTTKGKIDKQDNQTNSMQNNFISINISKLDMLLDLVGEIVITESIVTKTADIELLKADDFNKASRQLRKLIGELQDRIMSVRMMPIEPTFSKMNRIVRDMCKMLGKEVSLIINGGDTEIDKNIINHLSDPLMHLIRNSMDHGIELPEVRLKNGKPEKGVIKLSASNAGGEVVISICDDGAGLDKAKIINKANSVGLVNKPESEITDRDISNYIFSPGFSTKNDISEYSGRGVGLDVVKNNIEKVGGRIFIDSVQGNGTTTFIRIPLTLTIIDGMKISIGNSIFAIPTISIREFFNARGRDIVKDKSDNEMVIVRGNCYPVVRLHKFFGLDTDVTELHDGIMVIVEIDNKSVCLFADRLLGEQQIVIKPLPYYFMQFDCKESCISGCSILGDGSISLVIDVKELIDRFI